MLKKLIVLFAVIICLAPSYQAVAGPVFEDILNAMQIDQSLQISGDDAKIITKDKPLGQTFVTGDNVVRICRIAIKVAFWHEDWQEDETLVCTLWDSPQKKTVLGKFGIPYSRRQWREGITAFSVEADVKPNSKYYFELTVDGGDGKITGIILSKFNVDYPGGNGYEGGQPMDRNIWFETYVKKSYNKDQLYTDFFDNFNLDYPGMEKINAAVSVKDWDAACKEFLTYMESRRDILPDDLATPKPEPNVDTTLANMVVDQKWPTTEGLIMDIGPDWNYSINWNTSAHDGFTRTGMMKPLAFTYTKTGDEKYAKAWNAMLISFFRNVPAPIKSGVIKGNDRSGHVPPAGISAGPIWAAISLTARMHHETFYNRFRNSPYFEFDTRMAWWANLADMANTLERMDTGGNWKTQVTSSFFSFAQKYPEFKKSKKWFSEGFEDIKKNFIDNMYADGPCKEATTNYHGFSLGMFFNTFKNARELGLDVPKEHMDILERAFEYSMYITQPDWMTPIWGDTNRPMDQTGMMAGGAEYFNREDMLWVATKGKEGKKPSKTSVEFPIAGYYVMRSGWEPDARYLMTRNGFSLSHNHQDQLSVVVNAYGTDLLLDPGIYSYGTPECNVLTQTDKHNTIGVDGKNIPGGEGINKWYTNPGFDYYDGIAPGYQDLKDVKHQRSILFMKPDYWVIADRVTGPGEHTASQYWHFAPGTVTLDDNAVARTTNAKGGNIAVIPLLADDRKSELTKDVYAISWEEVVHDAPVVKHEKSGALPKAFCTVLYPYPADKTVDVKAEDLICDDASLGISVIGAKIYTPKSTDYVVFNSANKQVELNKGKIKTSAESAFVYTSPVDSKVTKFGLCNGTSLMFGNVYLASSKTPVKDLRAYRNGDTLIVDADGSDSSLIISTLGAKKAMVNGKLVRFANGTKTFKPF